jgi:hypothetical protein
MPPNKYWGKVDKVALASLVEDGDINISNTSLEYTTFVHSDYFSHHDLRNFRRNYRVFSAAFDLEAEYAGARRHNGGNCTSLFVVVFSRVRVPLIPSLPHAAAK